MKKRAVKRTRAVMATEESKGEFGLKEVVRGDLVEALRSGSGEYVIGGDSRVVPRVSGSGRSFLLIMGFIAS